MIKFALNAGHGYNTAGKRCLKSIDPNETREYILNKRICDKIQEIIKDYPSIEILRIDDGNDDSIANRAKMANNWKADYYIAVHHNAGLNGRQGGGIEVYTYLFVDQKTKNLQSAIYNSLIAHTGLAGNRSNPLRKANLGECRMTNMPAVLIENGFMDSPTDTPVILTEEFATKTAKAIAEVMINLAGATKVEESINNTEPTSPTVTPTPAPSPIAKLSVTYQVWDDVRNKWLPNVTDNNDYAGIYGHDVCSIYANLSSGNIYYRVHYKGGKWLPEVANRSDFAGLFDKPIDGLMMRTDTGRIIHYQVHLRRTNRWLDYVTGYSTSDKNNGYAGILGQEIDAIRIYID